MNRAFFSHITSFVIFIEACGLVFCLGFFFKMGSDVYYQIKKLFAKEESKLKYYVVSCKEYDELEAIIRNKKMLDLKSTTEL